MFLSCLVRALHYCKWRVTNPVTDRVTKSGFSFQATQFSQACEIQQEQDENKIPRQYGTVFRRFAEMS